MTKEQIAKLRKENDDLKLQVGDLGRQLNTIKEKMATFNGDLPEKDHEKSIQYLSDEYDDFKIFKSSTEKEIKVATLKLVNIEERLCKIDEAIESILKYSYQYNVKIIGIKQSNRVETSYDTVNLCLKLFKGIGAKVTEQDIDIAHRVKARNSNFPPPIVCKFTRRIAKESVMENRKNITSIDLEKINLSSSGKIGVFDHLTPYTQDLFNKAKAFQKEYHYAFCWTKNAVVLLKQAEDSYIIRVTSPEVLDRLTQSTSSQQNIPPGSFPLNWRNLQQQPFAMGYGLPSFDKQTTDDDVDKTEGPRTRSSSQKK